MGTGTGRTVKDTSVFLWKLYRNVSVGYRWLMGYVKGKGKKRFIDNKVWVILKWDMEMFYW